MGWGKGYKTVCLACRVCQSFRMLSHVCLVLDLEGFEVQGQFLVRELGWCDWTGQHWGYSHYYPTRPYPEAWKDKRLIRFVRRHIHGLPYTPAHREQARPAADLEQDIKDLACTSSNNPTRRWWPTKEDITKKSCCSVGASRISIWNKPSVLNSKP